MSSKKINYGTKEILIMRFLVTGVTGQLGKDVVKELNKRGYNG